MLLNKWNEQLTLKILSANSNFDVQFHVNADEHISDICAYIMCATELLVHNKLVGFLGTP